MDQYITKLKLLAKDCSFTDENDMVRDRIVFGVTAQKIRERLINEGDKLTLDKAIQIAQSHEYTQEQLRTMAAAPVEVHAVRHAKGPTTTHEGQRANQPKGATNGKFSRKAGQTIGGSKISGDRNICGNCGYNHSKTETCKAKGKQCNFCKKWNHFQSVCRSKKSLKSVHEVSEGLSELQVQNSYCDSDDFFVDSVECNNKMDQAFVEIKVGQNSVPINFKVDTGSQVNILPRQYYSQLKLSHPLEKPTTRLTAYSGDTLKTLGCVTLACSRNSKEHNLSFYVVETFSSPIIGLRSSIDLELIKLVMSCETPSAQSHYTKETVLKQYSEAFKGIGLFPGECKIHLDPCVTPVVNPPRRIPVALRDKVKHELDRMLQNEIIAKVTEPTEWVNSMVAVENPQTGKLRICIDPEHLNKAIKRPHYPMKTLEDVLPQLSGVTCFSKLDARSGYWNIKLQEQSSFVTTLTRHLADIATSGFLSV